MDFMPLNVPPYASSYVRLILTHRLNADGVRTPLIPHWVCTCLQSQSPQVTKETESGRVFKSQRKCSPKNSSKSDRTLDNGIAGESGCSSQLSKRRVGFTYR